MVESQAEALHGADSDGVAAFGVGDDDGLLLEASDGENGRLRLVDEGCPELAAKDAGVGEGEGGTLGLFRLEFLGTRSLGKVGHRAGQGDKTQRFRLLDYGDDQAPLERYRDAQVDVRVVVDGSVFE